MQTRRDRPWRTARQTGHSVVEDELLVAMLLQFILENLGYSVCALARSAPDAVAAAERHRPDIIMMDIRLADDTDGIVAAREIRDRFGIGSIFATAQSDAATKRRAEAARPLGFVGKPYVEPAIAAALERACADGER